MKIIERVHMYQRQNIPFTLTIKGGTVNLEGELFSATETGAAIPLREMWVLQAVKRSVSGLEIPRTQTHEVRFRDISDYWYNKISPMKGGIDVCEFDLSQAYWNIAIKKGYISQELAAKVEDSGVSKQTKRIALGALATHKEVYAYDGFGEIELIEETRSELEGFFWEIAKVCAGYMQCLMQIPGAVCYYTDAIVCTIEAGDAVKQWLNENDIAFKSEGEYRCRVLEGRRKGVSLTDVGKINEKTHKREAGGYDRPNERKWYFGKDYDETLFT